MWLRKGERKRVWFCLQMLSINIYLRFIHDGTSHSGYSICCCHRFCNAKFYSCQTPWSGYISSELCIRACNPASGRIPGYKRTDLQFLPCHTTKTLVWKTYSSVCTQQNGAKSRAYSTFWQIWQKLLPNILPTRPTTDLCTKCHKNAALIQHNSNLSEEEKSEVIVVNNK